MTQTINDTPELADHYDFLRRKRVKARESGLRKIPALNPRMFDYQQDVTEFLLRVGCGAAFLDTGLGKMLIELEFARVIVEYTGNSVLILAPLAVGQQIEREGARFGIEAEYIRHPSEMTGAGIWITKIEPNMRQAGSRRRIHKSAATT